MSRSCKLFRNKFHIVRLCWSSDSEGVRSPEWRCIGAAPTTSGCVTSCCMPFCTCCTVQWSTAKALPQLLPVAYNTHRPYFMPTAFILGCPSTMPTIAECGGQTPPHSDIIHYLIIRNAEASLVTRPLLSIGTRCMDCTTVYNVKLGSDARYVCQPRTQLWPIRIASMITTDI